MSWKCPKCGWQSRLQTTPKTVAFWCGRCEKTFEINKSEFTVEDVTFHRGRDMFEPEVPPFVGFVQEYPGRPDVDTSAPTLKQLREMRTAAADLQEWDRVAKVDKKIKEMVLGGVVVDYPTPSKGIVMRIPSTSPLAKRYGT